MSSTKEKRSKNQTEIEKKRNKLIKAFNDYVKISDLTEKEILNVKKHQLIFLQLTTNYQHDYLQVQGQLRTEFIRESFLKYGKEKDINAVLEHTEGFYQMYIEKINKAVEILNSDLKPDQIMLELRKINKTQNKSNRKKKKKDKKGQEATIQKVLKNNSTLI